MNAMDLDIATKLNEAQNCSIQISKAIQNAFRDSGYRIAAGQNFLHSVIGEASYVPPAPPAGKDDQRTSLAKKLWDYFARLRQTDVTCEISNSNTLAFDWHALILRGADVGGARYFPFVRFGGNSRSDKLMASVCRPASRQNFFLLSDIGESVHVANIFAVVLYHDTENDVGHPVIRVSIVDRVLRIGLIGADWLSLNLTWTDASSADEVVNQLQQLKAPPNCEYVVEMPDDEENVDQALLNILRDIEGKMEEIPRLLYLYTLHLEDGRMEAFLDARNRQFGVAWYLCPFFGDHSGAGGLCEAWSNINPQMDDTNLKSFLDIKRISVMRSVALSLLSGFEDAAVYIQAKNRGRSDILHQLPKDICAHYEQFRVVRDEITRISEEHPEYEIPFVPFPDFLAVSVMLQIAESERRLVAMPPDVAESLQQGLTQETLAALVNRVVWRPARDRALSCRFVTDLRTKRMLKSVSYDRMEEYYPKPMLSVINSLECFFPEYAEGLYPLLLLALRSAFQHAYLYTLLSEHHPVGIVNVCVTSEKGDGEIKLAIINSGLEPPPEPEQKGWRRDLGIIADLSEPWTLETPPPPFRGSVYNAETKLWTTTLGRRGDA